MDKLVSMWYKNQSLPQNYIVPPEARPGTFIVPSSDTIPVIDLSKAAHHHTRNDTIQHILKAGKEFGFLQVINHGVPEKLINETKSVLKKFFEMPAEDKLSLYSEDSQGQTCKLFTRTGNYSREETHYWRDNLRHPCYPLEECIQHWPEKPTNYREVVGEYSVEAKKLGSMILELICEGLGLESGYLGDKLSQEMLMSVNHYPPCPNPSLTLGLPKHCDPNLITILLQGDVPGLQVFKDGQWIAVLPHPNSFIINIGYTLQIMSNNKLKSAEHRAVTNSEEARTTAALFISPTTDSIIEPAKALTDACNPPLYRAFHYKEFLSHYLSAASKDEMVLEPFELQA